MVWDVVIHRSVLKKLKKLPDNLQSVFILLVEDLKTHGPTTSGTWKNYGKLKGLRVGKYHCHLMKGKPTYVCCWTVKNKQLKILEIYYVGTHEKAPY